MKAHRVKVEIERMLSQACRDGAPRGIGVAYEVGFSNLSHFSKVFKAEYGTLPSEYENR